MSLPPGHATAFERVVDDYDAGRPGYPEALYAALPPLAGRRVLEVGAGTGLATGGLLRAGAEVLATDPGPRMLARLHGRHPAVAVAVARAEALPLADGSVDAVCGAQVWHWVDVAAASAEVLRVLRPGGWLAVWWNDADDAGQPWFEAQQQRLEASSPGYRRTYRTRPFDDELRPWFADVTTWSGDWSRELELDGYERWLRSKSYVQALPDVEAFVAGERRSLAEAFPSGRVRERFTTRLVVART